MCAVCSVQIKCMLYVCVAVKFVRQFYIAQWYRDCTMEAEKAAKKLSDDSSLRKAAETLEKRQQQQNGSEKSDDDDDDDEDDADEYSSQNKAALKKAAAELDSIKELQRKAERRKTFLMQLIAARVGSGARIKYVLYVLC